MDTFLKCLGWLSTIVLANKAQLNHCISYFEHRKIRLRRKCVINVFFCVPTDSNLNVVSELELSFRAISPALSNHRGSQCSQVNNRVSSQLCSPLASFSTLSFLLIFDNPLCVSLSGSGGQSRGRPGAAASAQ